jgi:hypothetical protein
MKREDVLTMKIVVSGGTERTREAMARDLAAAMGVVIASRRKSALALRRSRPRPKKKPRGGEG